MAEIKHQKEIVYGISNGVTVKEISIQLNLSNRTVEKYLEQIREQYKAKSSCHLVAIFFRRKLIK